MDNEKKDDIIEDAGELRSEIDDKREQMEEARDLLDRLAFFSDDPPPNFGGRTLLRQNRLVTQLSLEITTLEKLLSDMTGERHLPIYHSNYSPSEDKEDDEK